MQINEDELINFLKAEFVVKFGGNAQSDMITESGEYNTYYEQVFPVNLYAHLKIADLP